MFRIDVQQLLRLTGYVLAGALFCGCWNGAVSSSGEEAIYQWMHGIAFGGFAGAGIFWFVRLWDESLDAEQKHDPK